MLFLTCVRVNERKLIPFCFQEKTRRHKREAVDFPRKVSSQVSIEDQERTEEFLLHPIDGRIFFEKRKKNGKVTNSRSI